MQLKATKTKNSNQQLIGEKPKKKKVVLPYIQRIGKSLLFPIALLPLAAIFLRVGALIPDAAHGASQFANITGSILRSIGNAVFGPILPVLFAIGVAFGMSNDQRGEAALVGFVMMILLQIFLARNGAGFAGAGINLVQQIYGSVDVTIPGTSLPTYGNAITDKGFLGLLEFRNADGSLNCQMYDSVMVNNVLNGIACGILVSVIYNNFNKVELPNILGFFSGRRLVPVLTLIFGAAFSVLWAIIFPWIAWCVYYLSYYMQQATGNRWANAGIMAGYGFINRLLIPFGLHHIPNTLFWFALGNYESSGQLIVGDINGFLHGDAWSATLGANNAGTFQSGIFPFMMFGLPAIAVAFKRNAENKEQAKKVAALLYGSAAVAFFTGITEPIEFAFMFISPALYLIYAVLCGICGFFVGAMQIQLGFGFSAGFIDYILSFPKSLEIIKAKVDHGIYNKVDSILANPGMLIPVGLVVSVVYYWVFKFCIVKLHMPAPGRTPNLIVDEGDMPNDNKSSNDNKWTKDARIIVNAIGVENFEKLHWLVIQLLTHLVNQMVL